MLKVAHISNIGIYTEGWHKARCGRATSSLIFNLMTDKFGSKDCVAYVYAKAGELVTGKAADDDVIDNENTEWGREYEDQAIKKFSELKQIRLLAVQKLIMDPKTRFSSTPAAIWVHGQSLAVQDEYNVSTLEVKCPRKYQHFIPLWECETPADLKKFSKKYFWQVVDQMDNCNADVGYFACYHPFFPPELNMRIIEFRKIDLWDEFKLLKERKRLFLSFLFEIAMKFRPTSFQEA